MRLQFVLFLLLPAIILSLPVNNEDNQLLEEPTISSAELDKAFIDWCAKYGNEHLVGTSAFETFKSNYGICLLVARAMHCVRFP